MLRNGIDHESNGKKKWSKQEIKDILFMKNNRFKFNAIALKYGVTANAVRKALQRHCPLYMNLKACNTNSHPIHVSSQYFLEQAIKKKTLVKKGDDYFYKGEKMFDIYECIVMINQDRIKEGLPIFRVRF